MFVAADREDMREAELENYRSLTGQDFDPNRAAATQFFAFIHEGELLGGFGLTRGAAMIWKDLIPEIPASFAHVSFDDCQEINYLWASPKIRGTLRFYIQFWTAFAKIMQAQDCHYFIVALDLEHRKLVRDYKKIMQGEIFRGSVPAIPDKTFAVWWTTPQRFRHFKRIYFYNYITRLPLVRTLSTWHKRQNNA